MLLTLTLLTPILTLLYLILTLRHQHRCRQERTRFLLGRETDRTLIRRLSNLGLH